MSIKNRLGLNTIITHNGVSKKLREWAEDIGLDPKVLAQRINYYHWPVEKAITTRALSRSSCGTLGAHASIWRRTPVNPFKKGDKNVS